ncbi:MAG TPA: division/cell wall cluster transcriptional repressor MraZ [Castellaniella sp.]|uniref:division/cell wall cluster transcriptional repressor MraZ n=1 Tax=Castellaniella sp. TaxID=1955812 RepID=UPI002F20BABF
MFQGSSALTLDAKGRMSIPARHRDVLQSDEEGRLTLTRHPDGCLLLYPRSVWESKREQIAALPANARALQRLLLGSAQDVEMDGAGRILVAPELRVAARLDREVMLLGLGSNFELWDRVTWEARSVEDVNKLDASILEQISF